MFQHIDQCFSDCQKVEKLLKVIQCQDTELISAKSLIDQQFPCDYIGACTFFSKQVACVHGPAKLEYKNAHGQKHGIYAMAAGHSMEAMEEARVEAVDMEVKVTIVDMVILLQQ